MDTKSILSKSVMLLGASVLSFGASSLPVEAAVLRSLGLGRPSTGATAPGQSDAVAPAGAIPISDPTPVSDFDEKAIRNLMLSPDRPMIGEFLAAFGGNVPAPGVIESYADAQRIYYRQGYNLGGDSMSSSALSEIEEILPERLAHLVRTFPRATFAVLGRDATPMGDALDAFYTSIGDPGRVIRLTASSGTLKNDQDRIRLLESAGLSLSPDAVKKARPFLIMDRTSYNEVGKASQAGQLLKVAYDEFEKRGGNRLDLIKKLQVVQLSEWWRNSGRSAKLVRFNEKLNPANYFKAIRANMQAFDAKVSNDSFEGIPGSALTFSASSRNGAVCDGDLWHFGYSGVATYPDGRLAGVPKSLLGEERRIRILIHQAGLLRFVAQPEFRARVQAASEKLNFSFPFPERFKPVLAAAGCEQSLTSLKSVE